MKLKSELYKDEQIQLSNKIIDILELDENNQVILYFLDNDNEKKDKIMNLIPELRKYFSFSAINGLERTETTKRPWLSIIRQITKTTHEMNYKDKQLTINDKAVRSRIYTFDEKMKLIESHIKK
jgi:hypothetical protein